MQFADAGIMKGGHLQPPAAHGLPWQNTHERKGARVYCQLRLQLGLGPASMGQALQYQPTRANQTMARARLCAMAHGHPGGCAPHTRVTPRKTKLARPACLNLP